MRKKLKSEKALVGMMLYEMGAPNMMRIIKAGGFDYVIIDAEHGNFDLGQIANLCAVANGVDLPTIIRIPNNERSYITKIMDMGATGLLLSMCESDTDIEGVVDSAKYSPIGNRGITVRRAHTKYESVDLSEFMKETNEKTVILVQIETKKGIDNLESIIANEHVDGVLIGPLDLSVDLGCPGNFKNEVMDKAILDIVGTCTSRNIPSGIISGDRDYIKHYRNHGTLLNSCNSEVGLFIDGSRQFIKDVN